MTDFPPTRAARLAAQADKTPVILTITLPQWQVTMLERWNAREEDGELSFEECVQIAVSLMVARYMDITHGAVDEIEE